MNDASEGAVIVQIDGRIAEIGLSNGALNLVTRALLRSPT